MQETLSMTASWDKTFPKSETAAHEKITFHNRYGIALKKYEDASELEDVSANLAGVLRRDMQREGERGYGRIRANLQATATKMESMLAYAEVQNALMRVYNSLGVDPLEDAGDVDYTVSELAARIDKHLQQVNDSMVQ